MSGLVETDYFMCNESEAEGSCHVGRRHLLDADF